MGITDAQALPNLGWHEDSVTLLCMNEEEIQEVTAVPKHEVSVSSLFHTFDSATPSRPPPWIRQSQHRDHHGHDHPHLWAST